MSEAQPEESPYEEPLTGGNVADAVVRVGTTVRKPITPATAAVEAVLTHLHQVGFSAAPRTLGRDDQGRHVLECIPGALADTLPAFTAQELRRLGALIRELHDVMATFTPPADAQWTVAIPDPTGGQLICHHDLAPWNLVIDGDRWTFIDWDGAGPGSPLWDLGYAAHGFVPLVPGGVPAADAPRLRALADGYDLDDDLRREFPAMIAAHTRGMFDLLTCGARTGVQPWSRLHAEGHADHWGPAADYIETHHATWLAALARDKR
ncbi:phosphotransferase enzyme family protein [Kribbella sp. DT2]|uniref:phosphotransferase enzyme family protein n=1 Tax=Kribbella sp. DT2 TaxID=3393427 RepID=UPI003CF62020